jgi:tetraacyldisaccharide 4'-kinase
MSILIRYALAPFSLIYGTIVSLRNMLFDVHLLRTTHLPVPVISVGNISIGGTGKTPMVAYIARTLSERGLRTAVLSRGYRRITKGYLLVSDGKAQCTGFREAGDEPIQLAMQLPGVIVAVDEKRSRGGEQLIREHSVDVIVLDDGFQHRWLNRDLDIVLIDASRADELRFLLPAGAKREPLSSIHRADIAVVTKYRDKNDYARIERLMHKKGCKTVLGVQFIPIDCISFPNRTIIPLDSVFARKVFLFSGIANPENFNRSALQAGLRVIGTKWFGDHHNFTRSEIGEIVDIARSKKAAYLITTEKDVARLSDYVDMFDASLPLYALRIGLNFSGNGKQILDSQLQLHTKKPNNMQTNQ